MIKIKEYYNNKVQFNLQQHEKTAKARAEKFNTLFEETFNLLNENFSRDNLEKIDSNILKMNSINNTVYTDYKFLTDSIKQIFITVIPPATTLTFTIIFALESLKQIPGPIIGTFPCLLGVSPHLVIISMIALTILLVAGGFFNLMIFCENSYNRRIERRQEEIDFTDILSKVKDRVKQYKENSTVQGS